MPTPVTIGVAVRFEGSADLDPFLADLASAARELDCITESEVVFCLNGATEETSCFLNRRTSTLDNFDLPFRCVTSGPGKINAHAAIARSRQLDGHLLFVDADVRFEPTTFQKLYRALETQPGAQACCAEVAALASIAGGWFARLQDAYYQNRYRLPPRRHLHGRCFILREWLDDFTRTEADSVPSCDGGRNAHLALQRGPSVDDIYYSRVLVHRFGSSAIAQVPATCVQFVPPDSLAELYRDSFRTEYELIRLSLLFPEHEHTERDVFASVPAWKRCLTATWEAGVRTGAYISLELALRTLARHRIRRRHACPHDWSGSGQDHHAP